MFEFVYWLKAAAAILITNSHYADIWPISAMAAGGHLGNCLFFLVSGFCLCNIRDSFPRWYLRRLLRIYPVLWVAVVFNLITGHFQVNSFAGFIRYFVYPTPYHFIASILVLYILFWLVRKLQQKYLVGTKQVLLFTLVLCAVVYLFFFDKSHYHIDDVEETWVRYHFWVSMLLGTMLREKYDALEKTISPAQYAAEVFLFIAYFAGKVLVSRYAALSYFQFLSPALLVALVWQTALLFIKLEKQGALVPTGLLGKIVRFLSSLTLEIYFVQNVIIRHLSGLTFPLNLFLVTGLIVATSWTVHQPAGWLQKKCSNLLKL